MEIWVVSFSLVLTRVGTFVTVLPLFGGRTVPRLVKIGLAMALASYWLGSPSDFVPILSAPSAHGSQVTDQHARLSTESLSGHWLAYGVALVREAVLGSVLGYAFGLFLVPARIAGEFIGQEMGLSLASLSDPTAERTATVFGEVFETLGILIFFGLDGHQVFLAALDSTFARWPIGGGVAPLPVVALVSGTASAHEWGLLLAAPLAVCLFVTSVVLALLARAAPQLNLLSVGFALRLGVGLMATLILLPNLGRAMGGVFGRVTSLIQSLV